MSLGAVSKAGKCGRGGLDFILLSRRPPLDNNDRHHPDFPGIDAWLVQARDMINGRGGLRQAEPLVGVDNVTRDEAEINLVRDSAARYIEEGPLRPEEPEPALKTKKGTKPR
jgi:hypothetical protein